MDDYPKYYGLELIDRFLDRMDQDMLEDQRITLIDIAFMEILARWWKVHCKVLKYWRNAKHAMKERFGTKMDQPQDEGKYTGIQVLRST